MDFTGAAVITGSRAAGWGKSMAFEVRQALEAHGILAQLVDVDALPEFCLSIGRDNRTIFIDFNHRIVFPWQHSGVSLMVDHPCTLLKELSRPHSEDSITCWVDASHVEAVKALGFAHRALFLPHAGPDAAEQVIPFGQREIDVFFAGTLEEPAKRPEQGTANDGASRGVTELVLETVDLLEKTEAPVLPAMLSVMNQRGLSPSMLTRDDFGELITLVLRIAELNRRLNILTTLPDDLIIAVASDYLPAVLRDRPNIRYLGYVDDFDRIRELMRNSRIVLNTTAKFPAGSHERIWYAMAEGAVVLTDMSVFMRQDFKDGENILYLPQKRVGRADLAPVAAIAKDHAQLARLAESASVRYRERHSWRNRAPLLIAAMRAA